VLWTRHRKGPDLTPRIRGWFAAGSTRMTSPRRSTASGRAPEHRSCRATRLGAAVVHLREVRTTIGQGVWLRGTGSRRRRRSRTTKGHDAASAPRRTWPSAATNGRLTTKLAGSSGFSDLRC
jgi:hypothetical protein